MIKNIDEEHINSAVEFSWKLYEHPENSSYPLNVIREEFKNNFEKSLSSDTDILLGYYKDNKLIGVLHFYIIKEDKYLQTTGVFIKDDYYNDVMDDFIKKLKEDYPGYRALLGFPKENKNANNYLSSKSYKCLDSDTDMRLNPSDFKPANKTCNIIKITEETFDEYSKFHDKYFDGAYWTSSKVKESFNMWNIFCYKIENNIEGGLFMRKYEKDNSIEIMGLDFSKEYNTKENIASIVSYALKYCFKNLVPVSQAIFFIEDKDTEQMEAAKELGFKYFSSYRCYEIML